MQRIVPNIWLNDTAEEAANFYMSAFEDTHILTTARYSGIGKEQHGHNAGDVLTIDLQVEDTRFLLLNGGPLFQPNPSISFYVHCKDADEVNKLWEKLSDGGEVRMPLDTYPFNERFGWVSDKFGVNWQLMVEANGDAEKIVPCLLFTKDHAGKAEEAMNFYTSVFPDSKVGMVAHYGADQAPEKEGTVSYGEFRILGDRMAAMDSAREHEFTFNEGVSLIVECETQEEIDKYWEELSAVPEAEACGWLKDKYGVSWQISPKIMDEMLENGTPEQIDRVFAAFMPMKKIDIATIQRAYDQK